MQMVKMFDVWEVIDYIEAHGIEYYPERMVYSDILCPPANDCAVSHSLSEHGNDASWLIKDITKGEKDPEELEKQIQTIKLFYQFFKEAGCKPGETFWIDCTW